MSKGAQTKLVQSKSLLHPSFYVKAIYKEYSSLAYDEEDCLSFKGQWRKQVFNTSPKTNLELEIGPGAGDFFSYITSYHPDRCFIAVELKYKPLIQTTRKIEKTNGLNARVIRYNACMLEDVFAPEELNNIYIHFPDPWPKKRHHKHRLIKPQLVSTLHQLQRKNSFIELKTDHQSYFQEIKSIFEKSPYEITKCFTDRHSLDPRFHGDDASAVIPAEAGIHTPSLDSRLHRDKEDYFITAFEKIFLRKKEPICYLKCLKV